MWYYGLEEDNLNGLARTVLHILLCIMFCCFQRERMGGTQEFQSVVLNLENEGRIQGKEMGRNGLAHRWCLIHATVTVVPWTSSHILYGLPLHQKGDVSKATC